MLLSADFERSQRTYSENPAFSTYECLSRSSFHELPFLVKAFSNGSYRQMIIADRASLAGVRRLPISDAHTTAQHWILSFLDGLAGLILRDAAIWSGVKRQPTGQVLPSFSEGAEPSSPFVAIMSLTIREGSAERVIALGAECDALSLLEKVWLMGKLLEDGVECSVTFETAQVPLPSEPSDREEQLTRAMISLFEHLVSLWPVEVACEGYIEWWWNFPTLSRAASGSPYAIYKRLLDVVQLWSLRENQAQQSALDVLQQNHAFPQWCLRHSAHIQPHPTAIASMLRTLSGAPDSQRPSDSHLILCDAAMHLISVLPLSELLRSPVASELDPCRSCCIAIQSLFIVATAVTVRVMILYPDSAAKLKSISSYSMCICRMSVLHDACFPSESAENPSAVRQAEIAAGVREFYRAAGLTG